MSAWTNKFGWTGILKSADDFKLCREYATTYEKVDGEWARIVWHDSNALLIRLKKAVAEAKKRGLNCNVGEIIAPYAVNLHIASPEEICEYAVYNGHWNTINAFSDYVKEAKSVDWVVGSATIPSPSKKKSSTAIKPKTRPSELLLLSAGQKSWKTIGGPRG